MPPDKMPQTVEFVFLQMLFQFVVACTQCSSELREKKKNQIKYYFIILFEIQNTNTLLNCRHYNGPEIVRRCQSFAVLI